MFSPPAIRVLDLSVRRGEKTVLSGFSLCLFQGERVALTGDSGAGKTTALKCVLGIAPFDSGAVEVEGTALDARSIWALRRRIGYVPQEADLGHGTADEVLRRPFLFRANKDRKSNLGKVSAFLERFHLSERILMERLSTLSGGERQRIALISMLLLDRSIHLLDEACSALDERSRHALADYYRSDARPSVLSVMHEPALFPIGGRVVRLSPAVQETGA